MAYPRNLEELTFKEISEVIKRNIRPNKRLIIAERTKFLETRQHPDESMVQFVHRLKERARYCQFERSGTGEMTKEDDLIMLLLINGRHDSDFKQVIGNASKCKFNSRNMYRVRAATGVNKTYNQQPNEEEAYNTNKYEILCKWCGERHVRGIIIAQPSMRHTPFWKGKNHAPKVCRYKKNVEGVKYTHVDRGGAEIFTLKTPTKTREKIKINGKYFHMHWLWHRTYSCELLAGVRKADAWKVNVATKTIRWYHN